MILPFNSSSSPAPSTGMFSGSDRTTGGAQGRLGWMHKGMNTAGGGLNSAGSASGVGSVAPAYTSVLDMQRQMRDNSEKAAKGQARQQASRGSAKGDPGKGVADFMMAFAAMQAAMQPAAVAVPAAMPVSARPLPMAPALSPLSRPAMMTIDPTGSPSGLGLGGVLPFAGLDPQPSLLLSSLAGPVPFGAPSSPTHR